MTDITALAGGSRWKMWRLLMWGVALFILTLPAVAMQFTAEVNWDGADFIAIGLLLFLACMTCELAARVSTNGAYRIAAAVAVGIGLLTIWVNLAVGMIGSEGSPYNLLFAGVLGVALTGSLLARFKPGGMAWAMVAAALAQLLAGAGGLSIDSLGGLYAMAFAAPWLLSAALFRTAARQAGS